MWTLVAVNVDPIGVGCVENSQTLRVHARVEGVEQVARSPVPIADTERNRGVCFDAHDGVVLVSALNPLYCSTSACVYIAASPAISVAEACLPEDIFFFCAGRQGPEPC